MTGRLMGGYSSTKAQEMIQFFAVPGASGKIRLKIEKPLAASSVTIRYKTIPWVSADTINSGTFVANITDDTAYKGPNQWYEMPGLTNGTAYYFKAFTAPNTLLGMNETVCKAGGLTVEYTFDNVSGTTVYDTSGNGKNGTLSNISMVPGKVGNAGKADGNGYCTVPTSAVNYTERTACFFLTPGTLRSGSQSTRIVELEGPGMTTGAMWVCNTDSSHLMLQAIGTATITIPVDINAESWFAMSNSGNVSKFYKDGSLLEAKTGTKTTNQFTDNPCIFNGRSPSSSIGSSSTIDQFRYFNRALEDYELANLYNNGKGC